MTNNLKGKMKCSGDRQKGLLWGGHNLAVPGSHSNNSAGRPIVGTHFTLGPSGTQRGRKA